MADIKNLDTLSVSLVEAAVAKRDEAIEAAKTELNGKIDANSTAITNLTNSAADTYLSKTDAASTYETISNVDAVKVELTEAIDTKVAQTAYDAKVEELGGLIQGNTDEITGIKNDYLTTASAEETYATITTVTELDSYAKNVQRNVASVKTQLDNYVASNDTAVNSKVAQTDYDTKMGEVDSAIADRYTKAEVDELVNKAIADVLSKITATFNGVDEEI